VGIAYQTVRPTMRELRDRGLVVSVAGQGTFVARDERTNELNEVEPAGSATMG